jgi:threonine aldolase
MTEGKKMIDLRSDTLTLPDRPMLETILTAKLGDDGRQNAQGRGEDLTTNELEDLAASLTGKEAALLFSSGTLANTAALLAWCGPGEKVMVDTLQHLYVTEKVAFDKNFGQLVPVFYKFEKDNTPDIEDMRRILHEEKIKLLCLENTHNFSGGTCTPPAKMEKIKALAQEHGVPVHMDGARLFNAAQALGVSPKDICRNADSLMFCLSKGLAAPIGSLLCGGGEFIKKARERRKLLGAGMRQCGIIAAPGIYALTHNVERLAEDALHAKLLAENLTGLVKTIVQEDVQTNIVMLDIRKTGLTPREYAACLEKAGLLSHPVLDTHVRLVFYKGITQGDAQGAAQIIKKVDAELYKIRITHNLRSNRYGKKVQIIAFNPHFYLNARGSRCRHCRRRTHEQAQIHWRRMAQLH